MNRKILSLIVIVLCGACSIFAQQPANFGWYSAAIADANAQNKAQTTVYGTKVDNAGYVYTMVSMGSDADTTGDVAATQGHFLGEDMTGAPYSGTSYNNNIMLVKHDFSGNVVWKVYSKNGDVDVSSSDYTPTADGGAFLALKARHTSNNFYGTNILLQLVGNNGTETTISFSFPDAEYHNVYQPVFVKVDADGNIVSAVRATVDWNPVDNPAASYTWGISDGFSLYGAAQDADGNFFVTGNLRRTMHIGENQILAHNVADWDGGSGFAGSAFVLKLNADLTYNSHIVTGGSSVGETAKMMKYRDGKLYVVGYLKGSNGAVTLGESQITPDDKYSFWTARINASDLSVDYLSLVQGALVNNKNFMQVNALEFAPDNSNFFVAGGIQGGFNVGTDELAAQGTVYAGFVFRCNAATGVADKGFVKQTSGISNNFGLVVNADSVFAYGYNWASSPKSNYFDSFNHNLESSTSYILAESLGSITAWSCAAKGDSLLIATRVQANKALDFGYATEATSYTSTTTWHGVIAEYTFPGYEFTAPQRYDVTLNVGENGSVTTDPETLTGLLAGTEVVFTIVPDEGYELDEFLLDGEVVAVENNTYTLNVTADAIVDVTFKLQTFEITLNVGENGQVSTTPENLSAVPYGTEVVFEITPATGYELDEFKVDGEAVSVENNVYTLTANANTTVDVTFKLQTFEITLNVGENGQVSTTPEDLSAVPYGTEVLFSITPDENYELATLLVNLVAQTVEDNTFTLNVTENAIVDVRFQPENTPIVTHVVTLIVGENGQVTTMPENLNEVVSETNVVFTIIPDEGYELDILTVNDVEQTVVGNMFILENVTEDKTVSVTFKQQEFVVTLNVGENGSVTTNPETLIGLLAGTEVVFTIVPDEGYELDEFLLDGEEVAVENNTYTLNVTTDATVDVTFKLIPVEPETYTITLNVGENGSVTTDPENLESIVEGTNVVFTIVPDEGYELDEFLLDREVQNVENNEFTLSAIDNDHEVIVSFKLTVAVDMIDGANVEIYSYGNELRIIGAENQDVFVYNLLGQLVDTFAVTSTDEVRTLNAGTYIVKAGVNTVQKIVIR